MKKSIFIVLMASFLIIVLGQLSFATCYRFSTNCQCGACSVNGQSNWGGPYDCELPELFCPSTQYCGSVVGGWVWCIDCPSSNPNCNGSSKNQRTKENTLTTKDPVDIFTGEAFFSSTDFSLSGRGPKLSLFRQYRSFSTLNGLFGYGWRTDFDINLSQDSYGNVTIYDAYGTQISFTNNSGSYINSPGNFSTLTQNTDNTYTVTDKYGTAKHYDLYGRLNSVTDRNGNILTFVYNPSVPGATYIQDASGRQIKLYFTNGHISSAVDPTGKTYQYGYDINGNLVSITDPTSPTGGVTNYTYDTNHKIKQFTNAISHSTYYQYDTQGREIVNCQGDANCGSGSVNKTSLSYGANNTTTVTDSLGKTNTYVFNDVGLLLSQTDPYTKTAYQTWDMNMNRTSVTDANNKTTGYMYDGEGNLAQITDPLSNITNMIYSSNFNLITSKTTTDHISAVSHGSTFTYDNKGNMTMYHDASGAQHYFVYDQYGNVITATDSRSPSNSTYFTYDTFGHIIQKTDALGNSTNYTYE